VTVNRDITAEVLARDRARREAERAVHVARLAEALAGAALSVAHVLDLCAEGVARIFHDGVLILLRGLSRERTDGLGLGHGETDALELAAAHDPDPGRFARTREVLRYVPPRAGEGFAGRIIASGEPLMRAADGPEGLLPLLGESFREVALAHDVRAVMGVPLAARGHVFGALICVRFGDRPAHRPDDLRDLQNVAAHVALAVANARLHMQAFETQEALRGRTRELEMAVEELEAVAYSVSHDVRAPLRSIEGLAQLIEDDCAGILPAEPRDWLRRLRAASVHLAALVDALLALSRVSRWPLEVRTIDVTVMAHEVSAELARRHPGRSVTVSVAPELTVRADAALLRIALENLMDNAWKFTARAAAPRVEVGQEIDGTGRTVFHVRDNGAGFDPAFAARLFEPFERLHRQEEFPGTGIGLATVSRIVRRHDGDVWAESAPGRGATFFFALSPGGALASP
jgi:signal transduction histidine kinase